MSDATCDTLCLYAVLPCWCLVLGLAAAVGCAWHSCGIADIVVVDDFYARMGRNELTRRYEFSPGAALSQHKLAGFGGWEGLFLC